MTLKPKLFPRDYPPEPYITYRQVLSVLLERLDQVIAGKRAQIEMECAVDDAYAQMGGIDRTGYIEPGCKMENS